MRALFLFGVLAAALAGVTFLRAQGDPTVAAPVGTHGVSRLLFAQPFTLDEPYTHEWRADGGSYRAGYLLVLAVDPELAQPAADVTPVLFAGDQVLERVNYAYPSGVQVAVLPSPLGADGRPTIDLARTPFWFGRPELPERVDAVRIANERAQAERGGLRPPAVAAIAAARAAGGDGVALRDRSELRRYAAHLILEHAPEETELALSMLAPQVR